MVFFMRYSCVVIIFFNTNLYKSAFFICSFCLFCFEADVNDEIFLVIFIDLILLFI